MATAMLAGDGSYSCEIVGEEQRQSELQSICGGPADNIEQECLALLLADASDPTDRTKVSVEINGRAVGNLSRVDANEYSRALVRMGSAHEAFACRAVIVGHWNGETEDKGYYSVGLDIVWPPQVVALAENRAFDRVRGRSRKGTPRRPISKIRGRLLIAALLCGGLVFAIWYMPGPFDGESASNTTLATSGNSSPAESPESDESPAETAAVGTPNANPICPDPAAAARAWEIVTNSGIVKRMTHEGDISVEDRLWDELPREDRIRFALASFCEAHADNEGAMLIHGRRDGKLRGSVVNGAWLDPVQQDGDSATP